MLRGRLVGWKAAALPGWPGALGKLLKNLGAHGCTLFNSTEKLMEYIYTAAAVSIALIWILGAGLTITYLVFWIRKLLRAIREQRQPHPIPALRNFHLDDPQDYIESAADALIQYANELGYVLTIETQPNPFAPLSMGNHDMVAQVRQARERYQNEGKAA